MLILSANVSAIEFVPFHRLGRRRGRAEPIHPQAMGNAGTSQQFRPASGTPSRCPGDIIHSQEAFGGDSVRHAPWVAPRRFCTLTLRCRPVLLVVQSIVCQLTHDMHCASFDARIVCAKRG